jgi:hypothetical protein
MISVVDFLINVLGTIGELCTLTVLESKTFSYDLRKVEQPLWKYHQKIARSRLSNDGINQGCKRDHPRPDFLSPSPFFAYLLLKPTQKGMENPRKSHPFYNPGINNHGLIMYTKGARE